MRLVHHYDNHLLALLERCAFILFVVSLVTLGILLVAASYADMDLSDLQHLACIGLFISAVTRLVIQLVSDLLNRFA